MQLSVISDVHAFDALKADWEALHAISDANTFFSSWSFCRNWWASYGGNHGLNILALHNQQSLVAILPLYVQKRKIVRLMPYRTLMMIGTGGDTSPDYLGPIVDPEFSNRACGYLNGYLYSVGSWDHVHLRDLSALGAQRLQALTAVPEAFQSLSRNTNTIHYASLPDTWDEYLSSLSANKRQQLRRYRRRLFDNESARIECLEEASDLEPWFSELVRLHFKRWSGSGVEHSFTSKSYNEFHLNYMRELLHKNQLRLWRMGLDGKTIAMNYCFSDGDTSYYFQSGFDPDFDKFHPGLVLLTHAMQSALEEGCERFDMLKGDYAFKRALAKQVDLSHSYSAHTSTPASRLHRALGIAKFGVTQLSPSFGS